MKRFTVFLFCVIYGFGCGGEGEQKEQAGGGTGQALGDLTVTVPEGWVIETPSSQMRKAQYRLPGEGGDAELAVTYFGKQGAGPVVANIDRWKKQFGHVSGNVMNLTVGGKKVTVLDISGTYAASMRPMGGGDKPKSNYRMLAAIVESPTGPYYFKLTGPKETVGKWAGSFDRFLKSVH